mgnify:CR=1
MKNIFKIASVLKNKGYLVDEVFSDKYKDSITIVFPDFIQAEKLLYKLNNYCLRYEHCYLVSSFNLQDKESSYYNEKFNLNCSEFVLVTFKALNRGSFTRIDPEYWLNWFWNCFTKEKHLAEINTYIKLFVRKYKK